MSCASNELNKNPGKILRLSSPTSYRISPEIPTTKVYTKVPTQNYSKSFQKLQKKKEKSPSLPWAASSPSSPLPPLWPSRLPPPPARSLRPTPPSSLSSQPDHPNVEWAAPPSGPPLCASPRHRRLAHQSASPSPADTQGPHVTSLPLLVVFHLCPAERAEQRRGAPSHGCCRPISRHHKYSSATNLTSAAYKEALPCPARAPLSPRAAKLTPCPGRRSATQPPPLSLCATLGRGKRVGGREKATTITPSSLPFSSPVPANRRRSRFAATKPHFTTVRSARTAPHPSPSCRDRPLACLGANRCHTTLPSSSLPSAVTAVAGQIPPPPLPHPSIHSAPSFVALSLTTPAPCRLHSAIPKPPPRALAAAGTHLRRRTVTRPLRPPIPTLEPYSGSPLRPRRRATNRAAGTGSLPANRRQTAVAPARTAQARSAVTLHHFTAAWVPHDAVA